jgi:isocitrate dehydrogenase
MAKTLSHTIAPATTIPMKAHPVTVSYGDGIGPEIMRAVLRILEAGGAQLDMETIEVGEQVYRSGNTSGIPEAAWDSLHRTKVFLKAPITTPQGSGYKSLNVTMRKVLGLYANVRPCVTYAPFVPTKHPAMDVVIVRENEEDLYAGIEHRQTDEVYQCLKLVSRPGTEKIIRYAFEYARAYGRRKVTCMTKDNIMKGTDGLFHKLFREVGAEYPDIEQEHMIIDIGAARLAENPERFDVIVTLNLYGDIISDIAAEVSGSVGLAGSANIGQDFAMFEAIHGSAPDIAGLNIANPSGLLLGALQMLVHIGQGNVAEKIHNAWLCTLEDGIHTADIFNHEHSTQKVGTAEFAGAVIDRLGKRPKQLQAADYRAGEGKEISIQIKPTEIARKEMVGIDVFVHWKERQPERIGDYLSTFSTEELPLSLITNRGVKVWPNGNPATFCTDHWRCRFVTKQYQSVEYGAALALMNRLYEAGIDIIKTENLYTFDGEPGFTLGQGQ